MHVLDLTLPTPAENLALEEALLDACDAGETGDVLRFWEPGDSFVVVGYANQIVTEVNVENCERDNITVFRRCSGGGTVLQTPGCLNYALVLRIDTAPELASIHGTNEYVLQRIATALSGLTQQEVEHRGHTDLTIGGLKISGNAQRRKRSALLFHGAFLLDADFARIERYLRHPSKEPDYRQQRSHRHFLRNLNMPAAAVKNALRAAWSATERLQNIPMTQTAKLAAEKYGRKEWNWKF